jgi:hypothetical protein
MATFASIVRLAGFSSALILTAGCTETPEAPTDAVVAEATEVDARVLTGIRSTLERANGIAGNRFKCNGTVQQPAENFVIPGVLPTTCLNLYSGRWLEFSANGDTPMGMLRYGADGQFGGLNRAFECFDKWKSNKCCEKLHPYVLRVLCINKFGTEGLCANLR